MVVYLTECPYCGAGPFRKVSAHIRAMHGKTTPEVRTDFEWTRNGSDPVRFCSDDYASVVRWDCDARWADGELHRFVRPERRTLDRWFAAVVEESARGWGRSVRLSQRWRISQPGAWGRIEALSRYGYAIPELASVCQRGHLLQGHSVRLDPSGHPRCRECESTYRQSWRAGRRRPCADCGVDVDYRAMRCRPCANSVTAARRIGIPY